MRTLFVSFAIVALLSGCAAPVTQQIDQLNMAATCCRQLGQVEPRGNLAAESIGNLSQETPLVMMNGKRSPAVRYLVPAELVGRQLQVRAAPMQDGFFSDGLGFAPIAVAFLAADGTLIAANDDSGLSAGPAQSIAYSYALWRRVTVPGGAVSAVFYSDPALYGTVQTFAYRFGSMVPAGGIVLPMSANAKAIFKVYGEFSVKVL
jgi:hypothetical protein